MVGRTLSHYRVVEVLGAGGMGEVYRAEDTELGRDVAIKILPESFAHDVERVARFEREAHLLAALNHPNVATLFGFESEGETRFLVMELVEGETLAERIARGPIPAGQAIPLFVQIAEGLEAAHEKGIIHRDLKPANIKISGDDSETGRVKILDFGLAKHALSETDGALTEEPPPTDLSHSPTLTAAATRRGEILGTAAYMSPEQARGKEVDARTDLWAFGCCLYEALSGRSAFAGETAGDTLAHILERVPDWKALPSATPPGVVKLLRRCLEKSPRDRLHHAADARLELRDAIAEAEATPPRPRARSLWAWSTVIAALTLAGLLAILILRTFEPAATERPRPTRRYTVPLEPSYLGGGSNLAVSPDGRYLCYLGAPDLEAPWALWVKDLESGETRRLEGSEYAFNPFFSPDGASIGFSVLPGFQLFRVALDGGPAPPIAVAEDVHSASWGADGAIVYTGHRPGSMEVRGLYVIPEGGGTPRRLTALDRERGEVFHAWPEILPGGDVVFSVLTEGRAEASLALLSRETGEWTMILDGGSYARYAPTGHLVYQRHGALFAVPFDAAHGLLHGRPKGLLQGLHHDPASGDAAFAFSREGLLVYSSAGVVGNVTEMPGRLVWIDLEGNTEDLGFPAGSFGPPALSPDGKRLAVASEGELWIHDLERRSRQRLSLSGGAQAYGLSYWSADSTEVLFNLALGGSKHYSSKIDGSAPPRLVGEGSVAAISPDRQWLVLRAYGGRWIAPADGSSPQRPLVEQGWARRIGLSPDGRWLAYDFEFDRRGFAEVFVTPFPAADLRLQVSTDGGADPKFSPDGRRIFYRRGQQMLAVDFEPGPTPRVGTPEVLFSADLAIFGDHSGYDVTPDGRRFLAIERSERREVDEMHVVENWFEELERLVPSDR